MISAFAARTVPAGIAQEPDPAKAVLWYDLMAEQELNRLDGDADD